MREDRRRDAEKEERVEIRNGEKKDSAKREGKKSSGKGEKGVQENELWKGRKKGLGEEDGKENQKKEIRSALGISYTENSMRDLSKRI